MNDNSKNGSGLFMLGLMLALGLVISSFVLAGALKDIKRSGQTITVKGFAEKNISADLAIWRGSFALSSPNMIEAYEKIQQDLEKTVKYLESAGFKRSDIEVSSIETRMINRLNDKGYSTNIIDGYTLVQSFSIKSNNVDLIDKVSKESTVLIKEGIALSSEQPEYYYTKINDMKISMLGEAAQDAKVRAEQLAENSGNEVGPLKSAAQGVFQITPAFSTDISDYGMNDVSSREKSIKAVVTMEYIIK